MRVARLPIGAELCEHAAQRGRTEVRHRTLRQEEETDVVGDESEAAAALLIGPAYPLFAGPQVPGGRGENQHRHPGAVRVAHRVVQLPADRLHAAEIVPGDEQGLRALALLWRGELDAPLACATKRPVLPAAARRPTARCGEAARCPRWKVFPWLFREITRLSMGQSINSLWESAVEFYAIKRAYFGCVQLSVYISARGVPPHGGGGIKPRRPTGKTPAA